MEHRNGMPVDLSVGSATGTAEREHALAMLEQHAPHGSTVGGEGLQPSRFVEGCRTLGITPHVAEKAKHSAIDASTTRHAGSSWSMRIGKRIEEIFG